MVNKLASRPPSSYVGDACNERPWRSPQARPAGLTACSQATVSVDGALVNEFGRKVVILVGPDRFHARPCRSCPLHSWPAPAPSRKSP